jgi:GT2 family glycosyltransferase
MRRSEDRDVRDHRIIHDLTPHRPLGRAPVDEPPVSGWVNYASWLSDDLIVIVGWFPTVEETSPTISLVSDTRTLSLETRCMSYRRADLPDTTSHVGKVVTARFLRKEDACGPLGTTWVRLGATTFVLGPLDLAYALTDLPTLLRCSLAWWDPDTRTEVMEFIASALLEHETANDLRLSKSLFIVREVLRDRLPSSTIAEDKPQALYVDTILTVDEKSFYVRGWMRDEEAEITHLTAISPEGSKTEILEQAFRYPRSDVKQFYGATSGELLIEENGFISYFETEAPSRLLAGWVFQMRDAAGTAVEVVAPQAVRDDITVRDMILRDLIHERLPAEELIAEHAFPAVHRIQERLKARVEVKNVVRYGVSNESPEESPDVSIIVPLYQRIDLLEQQLAQFVHDPEILQAELIYVLDSPELADSLRGVASQLFQLYRIPFSVVTLERNAGFSAVNNVGAFLARGRLLLLLNSDVLPDKPGWLGKLTAFYDSTLGIGALGPKLLFEDDSLQHAGIYFSPMAGTSVWENRHYYKGLHRHLPAANVPRRVPAVTGACMMIDSELYERFGGLRSIYVQGDYEDSDLCLRLIEAGYENWYLPDVELYHLEGQSYALATRQLNGRYNAWLHTRLWRECIEEAMDRHASPVAGTVAVIGEEYQVSYPTLSSEPAPEGKRARRSATAKKPIRGERDDGVTGSLTEPGSVGPAAGERAKDDSLGTT